MEALAELDHRRHETKAEGYAADLGSLCIKATPLWPRRPQNRCSLDDFLVNLAYERQAVAADRECVCKFFAQTRNRSDRALH